MLLKDKTAQAQVLGLYAIKSHKVVDCGISTPDYFAGVSIYGHKPKSGEYYSDVFTGIGATPQEAYADACEMAAEQYDTAYLPATCKALAKSETVAQYCKRYGFSEETESETLCYVALYVQAA